MDVVAASLPMSGGLSNDAGCLAVSQVGANVLTMVAKCATGAATQTWTMPAVGTAGVVTLSSNKCLDAWGGTGAVGTQVGVYSCAAGAPNQQWTLTAAGELRGQNGYCATVGTGATAAVTLQACKALPAQKWTGLNLVSVSTSMTGQLSNDAGCLAVSQVGANVLTMVAKCATGAATQTWTMPAVGTAGVVTLSSNKCLDAWGGTGAVGTQVGVYSCAAGAPNQQWTLTAAGELRGQNGYCATVGTGATAAVTLQVCKALPTQKWTGLNLTSAVTSVAAPAVTPAPAATQLVMTPGTIVAVKGDTFALSVSLANSPSGAAVDTRSVTWTSSSPTVATVIAGGRVVAVGNGEATIKASAGTATGSASVVVQEIPTTAATSVAMAVMRFDGGAGKTSVTNGVPLPPGLVTVASATRVHLYVAGREVPIAVQPLAGRHKDGSLRALLLQFDYEIPDAKSIPAILTVEPTRAATYLAPRATSGRPTAAALPTSPAYLTSTAVGGVLAPAALGTQYDAVETEIARAIETIWSRWGGSSMNRGIAVYEHILTAYQVWLRTGNPMWFDRANQMTAGYRTYLATVNGRPAPWHSNTEGLAVNYFVTGEPAVRTLIGTLAANMVDQTRDGFNEWSTGNGYRLGGNKGDDRMRGRTLLAMLDAALVQAPYLSVSSAAGSPGYTGAYTAASLAKGIGDVLATQRANGQFGGTDYLGGQKNYMTGILLTGLIRYYDEVTPDPRIPAAIQRATDFTWTQWNAQQGGFRYVSVDSTPEGTGQGSILPPLNGLILPAFAWRYGQTHAAADAARADAIVAGIRSQVPLWPSYPMQFDQAVYRVFNYLALRSAEAAR